MAHRPQTSGDRNLMVLMVGPVGLEPKTPRLKVRGAYRTNGPI
jgi:hypothetical protein